MNEPRTILFVVGPTNHPPGTHEVAAGARLLKYCVDHAVEGAGFQTELHESWPKDAATLSRARVVVFTGDQFPPYVFKNSSDVFTQLSRMTGRGCSIVCIHYATSVNDTKTRVVPPDVQTELFRLLGGFGHFLPGNAEPGTQARILLATITPTPAGHPVVRGVAPFSLRDEPYYPIEFDPARSGAEAVPLATALLPPENPKKQVLAWCVDRGGGSRSVSVVMPHFFANWQNDDLRKLVLNGIFWAAGAEIPPNGIASSLPPLDTFRPMAVEFSPPKKN